MQVVFLQYINMCSYIVRPYKCEEPYLIMVSSPDKIIYKSILDRLFARTSRPFFLPKFPLRIPRIMLEQIKTWGMLNFIPLSPSGGL